MLWLLQLIGSNIANIALIFGIACALEEKYSRKI